MAVTVAAAKGTLGHWASFRSMGASRAAQSQVQDVLDQHTRDLSEAAHRLATARTDADTEFRDVATGVVGDHPAFKALRYFDDSFSLRWWFPFQRGDNTAPQNLKNDGNGLAAARRALETRRAAATGPLRESIRIFAPAYDETRWAGLLEGTWLIREIAERFVAPPLGPRFRFLMVDEKRGEDIYASPGATTRDVGPTHNTYFTLTVADRVWWVVLMPTAPPPTLPVVVVLLLLEMAMCGAGFYLWRKRYL